MPLIVLFYFPDMADEKRKIANFFEIQAIWQQNFYSSKIDREVDSACLKAWKQMTKIFLTMM